jgi:hypothetical protein
MILTFRNEQIGMTRQSVFGFSWTTLFFGILPALVRRHWVGAAVQLFAALITFGISFFIFPFFYNKWHCKQLTEDNFKLQATPAIANMIKERWPFIELDIIVDGVDQYDMVERYGDDGVLRKEKVLRPRPAIPTDAPEGMDSSIAAGIIVVYLLAFGVVAIVNN